MLSFSPINFYYGYLSSRSVNYSHSLDSFSVDTVSFMTVSILRSFLSSVLAVLFSCTYVRTYICKYQFIIIILYTVHIFSFCMPQFYVSQPSLFVYVPVYSNVRTYVRTPG